jgi:acetyl-CoA synthetase
VVPRPHPVGGSVPHAVVVTRDPRPGTDLATRLLDHVAAEVTTELRVRSVEFVDELPHTTSGKLRRAALTADN